MRLGIDLGTTRTVVAAADRGNYPIVDFQSPQGDMAPWYPSLVAVKAEGEPLFALEAEARHGEPSWSVLRSFKRRLGDIAPDQSLFVGSRTFPALELVTRFLRKLKEDLVERSNLDLDQEEPLEAFVAVPAHANSNQRFMTLEAFRRAGFTVIGMMSEPSAAGMEFAHRYGSRHSARRDCLVVYDLGGGTFDASMITMQGPTHEVLASEGIARLGGDDFDAILAELVLQNLGIRQLEERITMELLELCRREKEALHPNSRRMIIDAGQVVPGAREVPITVADFYELCRPLVERTVARIESVVHSGLPGASDPWSQITALYLVGGSSDLPVVARTLRERYGRRVRRSPYPYAAAAIGLAIAADTSQTYTLTERFSRCFGVWREADGGRSITFDPIFVRETPLPQSGDPDLLVVRTYHPAHNAGCFRYLECSALDDKGRPSGDMTPWDVILFPFDRELQGGTSQDAIPICRNSEVGSSLIEERYRCTSTGVIEVTVSDLGNGFSRHYRLRPSSTHS